MERRARWLERHPLCEGCQHKDPPRITAGDIVDHVINLAAGGADDESNFQTLCRACHDEKTIRERGHQPKERVRVDLDGWPIE